jgi:restriction system protein
MPPRNLFASMVLGALGTLLHPFAFAARAASAAASSLGRSSRRLVGARQSELDAAQWTPELLRRLEWRRFEELCAAYFQMVGQSASILVQCEPWNAHRVGIKPVRALRGAMTSGNVGQGVLVTSGKFTQEARDFARKENISLIDGAELVDRITALVPEQALALLKVATQGDYQTPTCPDCGIKMIPRKSTAYGRTHWGCRNYPACKHTVSELLGR